jgi:hypothetical protein
VPKDINLKIKMLENIQIVAEKDGANYIINMVINVQANEPKIKQMQRILLKHCYGHKLTTMRLPPTLKNSFNCL